MDLSVVITIVAIAFIIWVLFLREINPSNKTDAQLKWMEEKYLKIFDPLKENKELRLVQEEIKKRESSPKFPENKMAEVKEMLASDMPERIFNKTIEISKIKGISEQDASTYFNKIFEEASLAHKKAGLSQDDADEKALKEVLNVNISKA